MPATRVYKIELLVVDHDGLGESNLTDVIEHARYPNWCISPVVMAINSHEVEWDDNHPLNNRTTMRDAYDDLFGKEP